MDVRSVNHSPPAAAHDGTVRCHLAIELSKKSWIVSIPRCRRRLADTRSVAVVGKNSLSSSKSPLARRSRNEAACGNHQLL
jgi:hypothetical protein